MLRSATRVFLLTVFLLLLVFSAGHSYSLVNRPPVADPNGPYLVIYGYGVTLDGSHSYDPDNPPDYIVSYAWDLNNDGLPDRVVGTSLMSLTWAELNMLIGNLVVGMIYPVKLKVVDSFQAWSAWASTTLQVLEQPVLAFPLTWGTLKALYRAD